VNFGCWRVDDAARRPKISTAGDLTSFTYNLRYRGVWAGSACKAGSAGQVVINDDDYGPNSGPNNLLLRGTVVTADGQSRRACVTYDALGRKVSETTPNANLTSCP
jgi:YD repeat-containing protein